MNRRYGVALASVLVASCSATDPVQPGSAGASSVGGGASVAGSGGTQNHAGSAGQSTSDAGRDNGGQGGSNSAGTGGGSAGGLGGNASGAAGKGGASAAGAGGVTEIGGAVGNSGGLGGSGGKGGTGGASGSGGNAGGSSGSGGGPAKYCDTHPLAPAPFTVTDRFEDEYVGSVNGQVTEHALPDVCDDPAEANAVGTCAEWTYKPATTNPTPSKLQWRSDPATTTYAPTCLAAGMTRVTFAAKGAVGGEKLTFGASQATPQVITLTNAWAQYSISLAGVNYNSDSVGLQPAFFWQTDPANGTIRFAVDDIKYVNN
ncbi:MAG TPA: hypothetical protein VER96_38555 [Polyangiaceae bacterium]|nr:hypothetical protein [Polyangiaceae bacterium]